LLFVTNSNITFLGDKSYCEQIIAAFPGCSVSKYAKVSWQDGWKSLGNSPLRFNIGPERCMVMLMLCPEERRRLVNATISDTATNLCPTEGVPTVNDWRNNGKGFQRK
jgi:hypothetical protein